MITIQAGYAVVVDDEPANRDFLERLLQTASFKVTGAASGAEGLKAAKAVPSLALALVDQELPDSPGLEIISKLRADNPEAVLVMATMHDDRALIDQAFEAGVDVFLVKPHGFMELYRRLQEVDSNATLLRRLIIDQYGPRPYKGAQGKTQEIKIGASEEQPADKPVNVPAAPAAASPVPVADKLAAPAAPVAPTVNKPAVKPAEVSTAPAAASPLPVTDKPAAPAAPTVDKPADKPAVKPAEVSTAPAAASTLPVADKPATPAAPAAPTVDKPTDKPATPSLQPTPAPADLLSKTTATEAKPASNTPVVSPADPTKPSRPGDKPGLPTDVTIPRRPKDFNVE